MDTIKRQIQALQQELEKTSDKERQAKLQLELARLRALLRTQESEEYYWSEER